MVGLHIVGPKKDELPLLWGFVRTAAEFVDGYYTSGDEKAAHESCQLAVHLPSEARLVIRNPILRKVSATMADTRVEDMEGRR